MREIDKVRAFRRRVQLWCFEQLYHRARVYDPLTRVVFGDEWHQWRRSVLPFVRPGRVLDLACGTGALLPELAARATAIGVDRSPSMLRVARGRAGSGTLVRAEGRALPFRDGSIATVVSTFPAPFILSRETLDEVARVLEPGGAFVVVLGGEITAWPGWRRPLGALVRLFYGSGGNRHDPILEALAHPALPGVWHCVASQHGHAYVWVAARSGQPEDRG